MSLNYDLTKIEDQDFVWLEWDQVYGPDAKVDKTTKYLNPDVESIIFATMNVGVNPITPENYEELYKRYLMLCSASGYKAYFKLEDVKKCVGLSTNASTKTYPAFKKDLFQILEREANWKVKSERDNL